MCVQTLFFTICIFQGKMHEATSTGNCTEPVKISVVFDPQLHAHTAYCGQTHTYYARLYLALNVLICIQHMLIIVEEVMAMSCYL